MALKMGTVVVDTARGETGVYWGEFTPLEGTTKPRAALRPLGGGYEWYQDPSKIRVATPEECAIAESRVLRREIPQ